MFHDKIILIIEEELGKFYNVIIELMFTELRTFLDKIIILIEEELGKFYNMIN